MENLSPAAYDKERFGEFANRYMINNPNVYADFKIQEYIDERNKVQAEVRDEEVERLKNKYTITDEAKNIYEQTKSERQQIEINMDEIEFKFIENFKERERLENIKSNREYYDNLIKESRENDGNNNLVK
jgi:hypothetical protein